MQRLAVVATLAFVFLAAPLGALCSSCCPETETAQNLGAAMPCCDEECGPTFATAKPSVPAVAAARVTLDAPTDLAASPACSSGLDPTAAPLPAFLASSPPFDSGHISSVLRL